MSDSNPTPEPARRALRPDPLLLWEVGLILFLLGLFIVLFLIPAARAPFEPHWFAAPVLAAGFFGVLILDRKRRKAGRRAAVREAIEEEERAGPS